MSRDCTKCGDKSKRVSVRICRHCNRKFCVTCLHKHERAFNSMALILKRRAQRELARLKNEENNEQHEQGDENDSDSENENNVNANESAGDEERSVVRRGLFVRRSRWPRLLVALFMSAVTLNVQLFLTIVFDDYVWPSVFSVVGSLTFVCSWVLLERHYSTDRIEHLLPADSFRVWKLVTRIPRRYSLAVHFDGSEIEPDAVKARRALPDGAQKPIDVWIASTLPRMPDGGDVGNIDFAELTEFVQHGPSALALRFDEEPPLYMWRALDPNPGARQVANAPALERRSLFVPPGQWWIGAANRSEYHNVNVRIKFQPSLSPSSWVFPFEDS
jgi:hypothetical protein